ncbi:MAG: aminotransferase class I/II-fold pyridoxal phosphate-dependent enzyme [Deltaproteobacteria bacterium]|nr:aminotransferase class I/II-fold pyridoxal phosphate-dependent enzyme [Deltaproteobacteria bacterium]
MLKLADDLNRRLEPQERFEQILSSAFRRFGKAVVDLSYANFYEGPGKPVLEALERAIADDRILALQYTPYGGRTVTRRLIATSLTEEYGLPFNYQHVILTPGATAALNMVFRTLFGPGEEVLLPTPCWHDYAVYLSNLGISIRTVPLAQNKHLDLEAIALATGPNTRGIVLSQPCCPTGVVYSKNELAELAKLLTEAEQRFQTAIYLVSDEVHRHIVWSGAEVYSPLLSYPRSLTIYSFGKALFIQGQRIGYVAVSPQMPEDRRLAKQLEQCERIMGYGAPTSLMQRAICDLIEYRPPLDLLARRQREARRKLKDSGFELCDGEATCFVYVKSPMADDFAFVERLAARGVLVLPSSVFLEAGHLRVSLTARGEAITRGVEAMGEVLQDARTSPSNREACER